METLTVISFCSLEILVLHIFAAMAGYLRNFPAICDPKMVLCHTLKSKWQDFLLMQKNRVPEGIADCQTPLKQPTLIAHSKLGNKQLHAQC